VAASVLVVENESAIRFSLVTFLRWAGYVPTEASNGVEALAVVAQHRPDVILLDLMLPEMDGWEFLRRVRAQPGGAHLPVLVLSGTDREAWDPANVRGVMAYLPKPFGSSEVLQEVAFLLDYAQARAQGTD